MYPATDKQRSYMKAKLHWMLGKEWYYTVKNLADSPSLTSSSASRIIDDLIHIEASSAPQFQAEREQYEKDLLLELNNYAMR